MTSGTPLAGNLQDFYGLVTRLFSQFKVVCRGVDGRIASLDYHVERLAIADDLVVAALYDERFGHVHTVVS